MKRKTIISMILLVMVAFIVTISTSAMAQEPEADKSVGEMFAEAGGRYVEHKADEASGGYLSFAKNHAARLPGSILSYTVSGFFAFFSLYCLFMFLAHKGGLRAKKFAVINLLLVRVIVFLMEKEMGDQITWSLFLLLILPILCFLTRGWWSDLMKSRRTGMLKFFIRGDSDQESPLDDDDSDPTPDPSSTPDSTTGLPNFTICGPCGKKSVVDGFCSSCGHQEGTAAQPAVAQPSPPISAGLSYSVDEID